MNELTIVNATLCAHSGANMVNRSEVATIPTPMATATFRPVPHELLINLIEKTLNDRSFQIAKSEFAIQDGKLGGMTVVGAKMFATLTLQHQREDYAWCIGLRASNDKTMAIDFVAGAKVFVCDNMALTGEADLLWRKHTSRLSLQALIVVVAMGVDKALTRFGSFERNIVSLKQRVISDVEAKANIYDAVVKNVIPQAFLPKVGQMYLAPPHVEFEPRTMWSLHNAYTEVIRTEYASKPHLALETSQQLGVMFGM